METQVSADFVSVAVVDSKGRIVIDSKIREMAGIKEGDKLRLALVMDDKKFMLGVSKA